MGKSKNTTVFTLEDGRRAIFNKAAFEYEVNRKAEAINLKNRKNRGGKTEVFHLIATGLRNPHTDDFMESTISLIKNWYNGNNGPSDLADIRKLAEIFNLDGNAFLKEMKEEKKMNATAEMINVSVDQNKIIYALKSMKEKEIAFELYSTFIDFIKSYLKADLDIWFEYNVETPEWKAALEAFPKRLPMKCAIQKAKMYLSEDTIRKAFNLLDTMYGSTYTEVEEPSEFKSMLTYNLSDFRNERMELYDQYLKERGIVKDSDKYVRDDDWNDFIIDLHRTWWDRLEEVFEDYLP